MNKTSTIVANMTYVGSALILSGRNENTTPEEGKMTTIINNTTTTNHTNNHTNITMEDIMNNDIKLKSSIARGAFDPAAWVVSTMNDTTAEAWGWYENPDTGRREIDPEVKIFWSWSEAASEFAPAARAACWGEGMTDEEIDHVAEVLASKACSWIGMSEPVEEWIQVRPALAEADDDDPAWDALMEESIAEVLAARA